KPACAARFTGAERCRSMLSVTERYALFALFAGFLLLGLALPLLRLYLRTGVFGLVLDKNPLQRLVGGYLALALVAAFSFVFVFALMGPGRLCVWEWPLRPAGWPLIALGFLVLVLAQAQMGASWRIGIDARPTVLVTRGHYR